MRCPPHRAPSAAGPTSHPTSRLAAIFTLGALLSMIAPTAHADDTGGGPVKDPEAGAVGKQPVTGAAPPALPPPSIEAPTTPVAPATPKRSSWKPVGPPKPPLPVEMTIVAASPDPP